MNDPKSRPPTTDKLRDAIDKGETGDKVAWSDPAAAPLGTDAEAAGAPPDARARSMEDAASPDARPRRIPGIGGLTYVGIALTILVVLALIAFFA